MIQKPPLTEPKLYREKMLRCRAQSPNEIRKNKPPIPLWKKQATDGQTDRRRETTFDVFWQPKAGLKQSNKHGHTYRHTINNKIKCHDCHR